MAAAIGAGLPVASRPATWSSTSAAAPPRSPWSRWAASSPPSVRTAGDEMDVAIIQYVKKQYALVLGERTAEEIKVAIGSAFPTPEDKARRDPRPRPGHRACRR